MQAWRRWESGGKRSIDPNRIISKGVKNIINHWRATTFGGLLFPMLPFPIFLPYLLGLD
jgi:hypothetical protein